MPSLLLDCTFVINELRRRRPPHGIPRVILAYLRAIDSIQLLYRIRNHFFILNKSYSRQIISLLLQWDPKLYKKIMLLLLQGIIHADRSKSAYWMYKLDQNGMKHASYFKKIKENNIRLIIMLHDLFPIIYPEYSDPAYAQQFEQNIQLSLRHAHGLICVSQYTQQSLEHYLQKKQLPYPPTLVAHLAPGLENKVPSTTKPIDSPYFVVLSTIVARKNHLLLLQIWRALVTSYGSKAPKLLIIGKRSTECSSTLALLDRCDLIRNHVLEMQVDDALLQDYLYHARALLFPTFAEGYGLPLIEALSMNVPVIASNLTIFHEIAQEVPDYLDPLDGKAWMALIMDYTQDSCAQRNAQLARIQHLKIPTWSEHISKSSEFVQQLSAQKNELPD